MWIFLSWFVYNPYGILYNFYVFYWQNVPSNFWYSYHSSSTWLLIGELFQRWVLPFLIMYLVVRVLCASYLHSTFLYSIFYRMSWSSAFTTPFIYQFRNCFFIFDVHFLFSLGSKYFIIIVLRFLVFLNLCVRARVRVCNSLRAHGNVIPIVLHRQYNLTSRAWYYVSYMIRIRRVHLCNRIRRKISLVGIEN